MGVDPSQLAAMGPSEALALNPLDPSTWLANPWLLVAFLIGLGLGAALAARWAGRNALRALGSTGHEQVKAFLLLDPEEGFDLEALNSIDFRALAREVLGEKRLLNLVMSKVDGLLHRVRSETEDPALAGAILRNKTFAWYRRSPSDPAWAERMSVRWAGIFHESRIPGGRLSPKLSARLVALRLECAKARGLVGILLRLLLLVKSLRGVINRRSLRKLVNSSFRRGSKLPPEPPLAQVCQAYLDDLAAGSRIDDRPLGLERLSELARRVGLPEVNRTLGELFPRDGAKPALVLDARFHPDIRDVLVTAPLRAGGEAITYHLVLGEATATGEPAAPDDGAKQEAPSSPWERGAITSDEWRAVLDALQRRKARLEPPPVETYRTLPAYLGLRDLLLDDSAACRAFLPVHWKGKPGGLVLLARLLAEGTFVPEAETDGDYLEAELSHIEKGNSDSRPKDGRWNLAHGKAVVREIAEGNMRAYRVETATLEPLKAAESAS